MSRTYRRAKLPIDCNCGAPIGWRYIWAWTHRFPDQEETDKEFNDARRKGIAPHRCCRCWTNRKHDYWSKRNHKRDNKPREKSPRSYKKVYSRSQKAKVKDAIRHNDFDNIPTFKKSNDYDRWRDYW